MSGCIVLVCIRETIIPTSIFPRVRDLACFSACIVIRIAVFSTTNPYTCACVPVQVIGGHNLPSMFVVFVFILEVSIPGLILPIITLMQDFIICAIIFPTLFIHRHPIIVQPRYVVGLIYFFPCYRICCSVFFEAFPNTICITTPRCVKQLVITGIKDYIQLFHGRHNPCAIFPCGIFSKHLIATSVVLVNRTTVVYPTSSAILD